MENETQKVVFSPDGLAWMLAKMKEQDNSKPNREELSNVIADEIVDDDTFEDFDQLTREELKKDLFDDLWLEAVEKYGAIDHTHMENGKNAPYFLNNLWLTYEEAQAVYAQGSLTNNVNSASRYAYWGARTNLPPLLRTNGTTPYTDINRIVYANNNIEVLNIECKYLTGYGRYGSLIIPSVTGLGVITNAAKLREIIGTLNVNNITTVSSNISHLLLYELPLLEKVKVFGIKTSYSFNLPKLNAESVRYMIENATNTTAITLRFHVDVYEKILANEGEWEGILELAVSKNIQIAS